MFKKMKDKAKDKAAQAKEKAAVVKEKAAAKMEERKAAKAGASGDGGGGAAAPAPAAAAAAPAAKPKVRPDVTDETKGASKEQIEKWYTVWTDKWNLRLEEEAHFYFDEDAKKQNIADQEAGQILGISPRGIEYFFRFLDSNGAHKYTEEDWAALGTDISGAMDPDGNGYLRAIFDADIDLGMEWLVFGFVKKVTAKLEVKFLDLFFGLTHKGTPVVGPATDFHSYTWQESIASTYAALDQYNVILDKAKNTHYFWWDIFCQNQHHPGDVGKTFSSTLEQVSTLTFNTPEFSTPLALGRVWCQFELANAVMKNKIIRVLPGSYSNAKNWCSKDVDPLESWVPVDEAQAKYMADKDMLLNLIDTTLDGGRDRLNELVRKEFVSRALGYRLWYRAETNRRDDDWPAQLKAMLDAGADPNFTNGHHTAIDILDNYGEDISALRAAGGKTNDELIAEL